MAGPILYSANPWFAHDVTQKYRKGVYFAWVSEFFDPATAAAGTAIAAVAPSSNPRHIYESLFQDVHAEDRHSALLKSYKRTFRALAANWETDGSITKEQREEIVSMVNAPTWRIWRPVLYVIARDKIDPKRIHTVSHKLRAGHGPELQIRDLAANEFDLIEVKK